MAKSTLDERIKKLTAQKERQTKKAELKKTIADARAKLKTLK